MRMKCWEVEVDGVIHRLIGSDFEMLVQQVNVELGTEFNGSEFKEVPVWKDFVVWPV